MSYRSVTDERDIGIIRCLIIYFGLNLLIGAIYFGIKKYITQWDNQTIEFFLDILFLVLFSLIVFLYLRKKTASYLGIQFVIWKYYFYALAIAIALYLLQHFLIIRGVTPDTIQKISEFFESADNWRLFVFWTSTVLLAPITEELVFRGALYTSIEAQFGIAYSIVVTSILWTALHIERYDVIVLCFFLLYGVILGLVRHVTGSITTTVLIHSAINLMWLHHWTSS